MDYPGSRIYFLDNPKLEVQSVRLSLAESHHLLEVNKTPRNSVFFATDGMGNLYKLKLVGVINRQAQADILTIIKGQQELPFELTLISAIPSKKRLEFLVEKATELGVHHFYPLVAQRHKKINLNLDRLNKITLSAVKQCGRTVIPVIHPPRELPEILSCFPVKTAFTVMDLKSSTTLAMNNSPSYTLLVGPEGGWSEQERKSFQEFQTEFIRFGLTTLRIETAVVVGLTLIIKDNI